MKPKQLLFAAAALLTMQGAGWGEDSNAELLLSCEGVSTSVYFSGSGDPKKEPVRGRSLVIDLREKTLRWVGAKGAIPITEMDAIHIKGFWEGDGHLTEVEMDRVIGRVIQYSSYRDQETRQMQRATSEDLTCWVVPRRAF